MPQQDLSTYGIESDAEKRARLERELKLFERMVMRKFIIFCVVAVLWTVSTLASYAALLFLLAEATAERVGE